MTKLTQFEFIFAIIAVMFAGSVSLYYGGFGKDLEKKITYIAFAIVIAFLAGALIGSINVK